MQIQSDFDIQTLLKLRKLTRAIAQLLEGELQSHLATLTPLFDPRYVLGEHIRGDQRARVRAADKAFEALKANYAELRSGSPFKLDKELVSPISVFGAAPQIVPYSYTHEAISGDTKKIITITSPLRWVLTYRGLDPDTLRVLLAKQEIAVNPELQSAVLHYLVMRLIVSREPGIKSLLDALRFPVSFGQIGIFGRLPVIYVSTTVTTTRPPDAVLIESTEITGTTSFEEVVNYEEISELVDPVKAQLMSVLQTHAPDFSSSA